MIRDVLFCATHPFQCISDAMQPWMWWALGIFVALIALGIILRVWNLAYAVGGKPAAIGAVGVLGTIAIALLSVFVGRKDASEPTDIDGPDGTPSPRPKPKPRPKREPGGPIFPNAPWHRRT